MRFKFWERYFLITIVVVVFLSAIIGPKRSETVAQVTSDLSDEEAHYLEMLDEHDVMMDFIDNARSDPTTGDYFIGESYHGIEVICVNMGGANGYVCQ